jgi:hypothetical protein
MHHFTIGFQKPGICADSWFLESNGKMVQWDFSLISTRGKVVNDTSYQKKWKEKNSMTLGKVSPGIFPHTSGRQEG